MTAQPTIPNPRRNPGDEMLTLQEACAFLRVPEGTLRYWRHLGCHAQSLTTHSRRSGSNSARCQRWPFTWVRLTNYR